MQNSKAKSCSSTSLPSGAVPDFNEAYSVTGIPQVVLIDRTGTVRLVRVGCGGTQAHELDAKLAELFGDPAPAAKAANSK